MSVLELVRLNAGFCLSVLLRIILAILISFFWCFLLFLILRFLCC